MTLTPVAESLAVELALSLRSIPRSPQWGHENMRNFYERMKMNNLNFEESVREVVRCQAKDVKLYASSVSSKKNVSLVRVRSSAQEHLYGKIKVFLEHNVNCLQTLWMYLFDTVTTSHIVCHISDKHIFQRLVHVNLLEEPAVYAKKDGGMDILNVGHLNMKIMS